MTPRQPTRWEHAPSPPQRHQGSGPADVYDPSAFVSERASRELGEVIYLFVVGSSGQWRYERARDGVLVRGLLVGVEPSEYLMVRGEPEAWELELFSPRRLTTLIAGLADDLDPADVPAAEQALRALWAKRRIELGASEPRESAEVVWQLVLDHYGLITGERMSG